MKGVVLIARRPHLQEEVTTVDNWTRMKQESHSRLRAVQGSLVSAFYTYRIFINRLTILFISAAISPSSRAPVRDIVNDLLGFVLGVPITSLYGPFDRLCCEGTLPQPRS